MTDRLIRVLLVDDDEEDYLITRDLFWEIEDTHYELDWEGSYEDGLARIKEQAHDVYLLDYHLGAHDGLELLREALRAGVRAPMIMLTGQGGRKIDLEASRAGAYDYLVKGAITAHMLERSIRYALQHARSVEALRSTVRMSSALLTVMASLDAGVVITDPLQEGNPILYANAAYFRITGYPREEVLGRNGRFLQGPLTDPGELSAIQDAVRRGEPYEGRLINYRRDGSTFLNHLTIIPVRDNRGQLVNYAGILRDYSIEL